MPNVRCSHSTKKLSKSRAEYLKGSDTHMGNKQGEVLYCRLFEDYIYEHDKLITHQELEIALPTELMRKNLSCKDWEKIAKKFENIVTVEMGYENVSIAIHYRDETNGRTNNDNLHIHLGYIDRVVKHSCCIDTYDTIGKIPYAINLNSGKVIKKRDFQKEKINHLKIEVGDVKLDFNQVQQKLLEEMTSLSKKRNPDALTINKMHHLKNEIIAKATPKSREFSFSNRLDKNLNHYQRMKINKNNCCNILKELCVEFNLTDTINLYGKYCVGNWKDEKIMIKSEIDNSILEAEVEKKNILKYNDNLKRENSLALKNIGNSENELELLKKEKEKHDNLIRTQKEEALNREAYNREITRQNIQIQNALLNNEKKLKQTQKNIDAKEKKLSEKYFEYNDLSKKILAPLQELFKSTSTDLDKLVEAFMKLVSNIRARETEVLNRQRKVEDREYTLFNSESWHHELGYVEACINNDIALERNLENNFDDLYSELILKELITENSLDIHSISR